MRKAGDYAGYIQYYYDDMEQYIDNIHKLMKFTNRAEELEDSDEDDQADEESPAADMPSESQTDENAIEE